MTINKSANNETEQRVLTYLESLDNPQLIKKINSTDKGIPDALDYVKAQVRSRAKNGCAVVEDQEVFGMIIHYFEEDSIKKGNTTVEKKHIEVVKTKPSTSTEKPKAAAVQKTNDLEGQMSLFDL